MFVIMCQVFDDCDPNEFTQPEVTIGEDEFKNLCNIAIRFIFDQVPEYEKLIKQIKLIFDKSRFTDLVYFDDVPFVIWIKSIDGPQKERFYKETAENLKKVLNNITHGQIYIYVHSDSKQLGKVLNNSNLRDMQIIMTDTCLDTKRFANAM